MSSAAVDIKTCPPHHWEITTVRADGSAHYHHLCRRCAAQKDVPISTAVQAKPWRLSKSAAPSAALADEGLA